MKMQQLYNQEAAINDALDQIGNIYLQHLNDDGDDEPYYIEPEESEEDLEAERERWAREERERIAREKRERKTQEEQARKERERIAREERLRKAEEERRQNEPARPLTELSSLSSVGSPYQGDDPVEVEYVPDNSHYTRDLFGSAHEPARTLVGELVEQVEEGDEVDVREAARSGIKEWLKGKFDSAVRGLIERLPEDKRFDAGLIYKFYVNPNTRMIIPNPKNVQNFYAETSGDDFSNSIEQ